MTVSIVGCGWLGLAIGKNLLPDHHVKGSTTTKEKIDKHRSLGIDSFYMQVRPDEIITDRSGRLDADVIYINIPPGRRDQEELLRYPDKIQQIIDHLSDRVQRIIFISSTGVYPDVNGVVDENTSKPPTKGSGQVLLQAEEIIKNAGRDWIILRMAGLMGPDRYPARWFAGKSDVPNGLAPVNMVHQADCVAISRRIIEDDNITGQIYNVCADEHPTKIEFYTQQCTFMGLEPPRFRSELLDHKIVSNEKLRNQLGYKYLHPNPALIDLSDV